MPLNNAFARQAEQHTIPTECVQELQFSPCGQSFCIEIDRQRFLAWAYPKVLTSTGRFY